MVRTARRSATVVFVAILCVLAFSAATSARAPEVSASLASGARPTWTWKSEPGASLVVGGSFTTAGGVPAENVAVWNSAAGAWSALGEGAGATVRALAVDSGGRVYAGGPFHRLGNVKVRRAGVWDPAFGAWDGLGTGVDHEVYGFAVGRGNRLYAVGGFSEAGGAPARAVGTWDPASASWSGLGGGILGIVQDLALGRGFVAVGGMFTEVGGRKAGHVARWDTNSGAWDTLGGGFNQFVSALATGPDGEIYAAGRFTIAGGIPAQGFAVWSPIKGVWEPPGNTGFNGAVSSLLFWRGSLYAGGGFTTAGGVQAARVARFDPETRTWSALGDGIGDGEVLALAGGADGRLYAAGSFTRAGGELVGRIAAWDPGLGSWTPVGGGVDGTVFTLAPSSGPLYRIKLDDPNLDAGATVTTATSFTPGSDLLPGLHTLYVQRGSLDGVWGGTGRASISIGRGEHVETVPHRDAVPGRLIESDIEPTPEAEPVPPADEPPGDAEESLAEKAEIASVEQVDESPVRSGGDEPAPPPDATTAAEPAGEAEAPEAAGAVGGETAARTGPASQEDAEAASEPLAQAGPMEAPPEDVDAEAARLTNDPTPGFAWKSGGGGSGLFRYRLGSEGDWTETLYPEFTPENPLPDGVHVLYVSEANDAGAWSRPAAIAVRVDTTPPDPPEVSGDTPTSRLTPTWNWKGAGGGAGVFSFQLGGTEDAWTETTVTSWSPSVPFDGDGSHTLYVRERDRAGNWSEPGEHEIVIDTGPPNPPSVSVKSPTGDTTPEWTWESGGQGAGVFQVQLDGAVEGRWTDVAGTSYSPSRELADKSRHTLYVRERDEAGNWSRPASAAVMIDTGAPDPPKVSVDSPTPDRTPTWSWRATGDGGAGLFRIQLNGTEQGRWSETRGNEYTPRKPLRDKATHTLYVQETDPAGNWSDSGSAAVEVDSSLPTAPRVEAPGITSSRRPTWRWEPTGIGTGGFRYRLDDGEWNETRETSFTPASPLAGEGAYTLYVQELRRGGEWSDEGAATVNVDTTPPEFPAVVAKSPVNDTTPTWTWKSSGGAGVFRVQLDSETGKWTRTDKVSFEPAKPLAHKSTHTLYVQERDEAGNWSASGSASVEVDIQAPAPPSVEVATPPVDATPTWTWKSGGGGMGLFRYQLNATRKDRWTETEAGEYTSEKPLRDGRTYILHVQERDRAGNWSASGSAAIAIDLTPPGIPEVVGPGLTNDPRPVWRWTSGGNGAGAYRYRLGEDGEWTETSQTEFVPAKPLSSDGEYTLYVAERDEVGNWSGAGSHTMVIDTTPPEAPVVVAESPVNDTTPTWTWKSGGGVGAYRVQVGSENGEWTRTDEKSYTLPEPADKDGSYTLYVQERDRAGNWSASGSASVEVDIQAPAPPSVEVATPPVDATPTWTWKSGGGGMGLFRYQLNATRKDRWTETEAGEYTSEKPLRDGRTYILHVQERDRAGNWSASGSAAIAIDLTPPGIPEVVGPGLTNDPRPVWRWTSGGNGAGAYRYRLGEDGEWTETSQTEFVPAKPLSSDGEYTLYVAERDEVGNWSGAGSHTMVIDTTPPEAPVVVAESPVNDTTPTWTWKSGGGVGAYRVQVGSENGEWTRTDEKSYTLPEPADKDGSYTLYVQERDRAGNWSASGSAVIHVDITGPRAPRVFATSPTGDTTPLWQWDSSGGGMRRLYVAGEFSDRGTSVAEYGFATDDWKPLGSGIPGRVNALVVSADGTLFAGGAFDTAGGVRARNFAAWDPGSEQWREAGVGIGGEVRALAHYAGRIYLAGDFTDRGNHVARFDARRRWWAPLGDGVNGKINDLVFSDSHVLYAGGRLPEQGGVAEYEPATGRWNRMGGGPDMVVNDLASVGNDIYACGESGPDGGTRARCLVWRAEQQAWVDLGLDYEGSAAALAVDRDGVVRVSVRTVNGPGLLRYDPATERWREQKAGLDRVARVVEVVDGTVLLGGGFTRPGHGLVSMASEGHGFAPLGGGVAGTVSAVAATGLFRYSLDDDDMEDAGVRTALSRFIPGDPLEPGAHVLYVQERDEAGNWSDTGSRRVTIDATPPEPPGVSGPQTTNSARPEWTWRTSAKDGSGMFRHRLNEESSWTLTTAVSFRPDTDLDPARSHTLYVQERDEVGNWSDSASHTVTMDRTPPPAPVVDGPEVTNDLLPGWTWKSGGGDGAGVFRTRLGREAEQWSETDETAYTPPAPLQPNAQYVLFVQERDPAGNWSDSGAYTVVVDSIGPAPPKVTVASPTNDTTPTFAWKSMDDGDGVGVFRHRLAGTQSDWTVTEKTSYTPDDALRPDGEYVLEVQERDRPGNWSHSGEATVVVDTVGPEPPVISAKTPTNDLTPTWTWKSGGQGGTGVYRYRLPGAVGGWTEIRATEYTPGEELRAGWRYPLYVQEQDEAGNWSGDAVFEVVIDLVPPKAPVVGGKTPTNDTTPEWRWEAAGGGAGLFRVRTDSAGGEWIEVDTPAWAPGEPMAEGAHVLYVQERDEAGNWSESGSHEVVVDLTPPEWPGVMVESPTSDTTPTWTWSSGGGGAGFYRYRLDGETGDWTLTEETAYTPEAPFTDGESHTLYVQERDEAGNWSTFGAGTVVIDTTGPDAPEVSGPTPTNDLTPTWTWKSGGGGGTGVYRYQLDGKADGGWTETKETSWTASRSFSGRETHTLFVQERDKAGNWSAAGSHAIEIDTEPPPPPELSATTPTNDPGQHWTWKSGGGSGVFRYQVDGKGGEWVETREQLFSREERFRHGESHTLYVRERDQAGNWSEPASLKIVVDLEPPDPPLVTGPEITNDTTPSWTWESGGNGGIGLFRYRLSDGDMWVETEDNGYTPEKPFGDATENTLYVQERDEAGNWSDSGTHTVAIDTTPPNRPLLKSRTPTNDIQPTWTWESGGGGQGVYQYQLDSEAPDGWIDKTTTTYIPARRFGHGETHVLRVRERDRAGNWSEPGELAVYVDISAPKAPALDEVPEVVNASPLSLSGRREPHGAVLLDGEVVVEHGLSEEWSADVPLSEGVNTFSVAVRDPAGNVGAPSTVKVRLDTTPPANPGVKSAVPAVGETTREPEVRLAWTPARDEATGVAAVSWSLDRDAAVSPDTEPEASLPESVSLGRGDGKYYVHARTRDGAGNWSEASHYGPWILDTTPPRAVEITTDGGNGPGRSFKTSEQQVVLSGSVAPDTAELYVNGSPQGVEYDSGATSFRFTGNLAPGENPYTLSVRDAVGNENTTNITVSYVVAPGNYYVDVSAGTDDMAFGTGPGTLAFKTLHYAMSLVNHGISGNVYTLHLAPGVYSVERGEEDAPLVVKRSSLTIKGAANGEPVVISGSGARKWTTALEVEAGGVILENVSVREFKTGVTIPGNGSGFVLRANEFLNVNNAVEVEGAPGRIVRNVLRRPDAQLPTGMGMKVVRADVRIENNVVQGYGTAVHLEASAGTITNNTFHRNSLAVRSRAGKAVAVRYNIVANSVTGFLAPPNLESDYNVFWKNDMHHGGGCEKGERDVFADPGLVDPDAGDFSLAEGSAAIDATDRKQPGVDLAGKARPAGETWDAGAWELHP